MALLGGSFRTRLIGGAIVWITLGVGITWYVLGELFRAHAVSEFVDELDHHATELVNLLERDADGRITVRVPLSDHHFLTPRSGYYWQVDRANGAELRSPSLGTDMLPLPGIDDIPGAQREAVVAGPTGPLMLLERVVRLPDSPESLRVAVGTDQRLVNEFLASFRTMLGIALGTIGLGLIGAAFAQIAFGLAPLRRIRAGLQAVQRGEAARLPADLPGEVAPLAENVNALLDAKEEMVRHARIQAGNLAHALKTPLAILQDEGRRLEAAGQDGRAVLAQCNRMRRQIDYHLARARAAASRMARPMALEIGPPLRAIAATVGRLHQDRGLQFELVPYNQPCRVICEPEDVDEILGNLIDNAAKWARGRVRISVASGPGRAQVTVEDDGPGMPADMRERVFQAGERLDERMPGTGLGLAIVRDITALYGGRVWIDDSELGGVAVHVELPSPAGMAAASVS